MTGIDPSPSPIHQRRFPLREIGLLIASLLLALLLAEITVRVISTEDEDGQKYVYHVPLKPYQLPIQRAVANIEDYRRASESYTMYDPTLGWTVRPNATSVNGLYSSNAAGMRGDHDYALDPPEGVLRVALFGDSFTHGTDVANPDAWAAQLETLLNEGGQPAEVLNFGVGGYGMDQAYLRWQQRGCAYQPDLVIFGFRAENTFRNLNVIRLLYNPANEIPLSKPRFILGAEGLEVINQPALPPDEVPAEIAHFWDSPLRQYEYYYNDDYIPRWWLHSELLGFITGLWSFQDGPRPDSPGYDPDGDAVQLALAIIAAFHDEVTACGADFMIVHMPRRSDLRRWPQQPFAYQDYMDLLDAQYPLIHPEEAIAEVGHQGIEPWHYTVEESRAVAEVVYAALLEYLAAGE